MIELTKQTKAEVEKLWSDIIKISKCNPSIVFYSENDEVYLYEILVKLGKIVKEKFGRGFSYRNDIGGVYDRNSRRRR